MKGSLSARQGELAAAGTPTDSKSAVAAPRGPATPAFDAATTASEVALGELRRLLGAWRQHEPGARLGHDPEALHQLRVTTRRIDTTLGLFSRQLPVALAHARGTAKSVLRTLGAARDLDVQLAELARHSLALPESERAAVEPLRARLESERCRARAHMAGHRLAALAAEPANALPAGTLFLMGRLAERHATTTAQARKSLTRSWRKVRGQRWRALRSRLGELLDNARQGSSAVIAEPVPAASAPTLADGYPHPAPEPQPHPLEH